MNAALVANLEHAAFTREGATIGGGKFSPAELAAAAATLKAAPVMLEALRLAHRNAESRLYMLPANAPALDRQTLETERNTYAAAIAAAPVTFGDVTLRPREGGPGTFILERPDGWRCWYEGAEIGRALALLDDYGPDQRETLQRELDGAANHLPPAIEQMVRDVLAMRETAPPCAHDFAPDDVQILVCRNCGIEGPQS